MGGTQPVGCTRELSDFGFMQELKGFTDGDKFFVNGITDKCGCRAFVSWCPRKGPVGQATTPTSPDDRPGCQIIFDAPVVPDSGCQVGNGTSFGRQADFAE